MRKILITAAIVVAATWPALGQSTSLKGASQRDSDFFILAAAITLAVANIYAGESERTYCLPAGAELNDPKKLWAIVDETLTGQHRPEVVAAALIEGLRRNYPC